MVKLFKLVFGIQIYFSAAKLSYESVEISTFVANKFGASLVIIDEGN